MSTASVSANPTPVSASTTSVSEASLAGDRPGGDVTWPAVWTIAWREVVRFFRQRNRVIAAVVTPVVFWLLLGFGLNQTFEVQTVGAIGHPLTGTEVPEPQKRVGYLEFFFPGMVVMMVLFTSIFSTITVIDDRNSGFLQGVLASPTKRWAIVLGKVLGGATIATLHGLALLPIWYVFFAAPGPPEVLSVLLAIVAMFVMAVGLTGLGLMFAWPMDSTAGYHAVMNLVQFPMWFLCGAVFPLATAGALKWVMYANPLTYANAAFAAALQGNRAADPGLPIGVAWLVMGGSALLALALATRVASKVGKS